jgi:hypothetical protein
MNVLDLIPSWAKLALATAAVAAALAAYAAHIHHQRNIGRTEVQLKWDASVSQQRAQALVQAAEDQRIENRRQSMATEIQQRKDNEFNTINARLAAALERLQQRPDRPAPGSAPTSGPAVAQGCTGAGLYRPDGQFLAGEAAAATRIGAERDYCYARYNTLVITAP